MIVLAHIFGAPIEEYAFPWISGAGAGVLMVLVSGIRTITLKHRIK